MKHYLTTNRLFLRAIDDTDAENLHNLNKDPDVMKYLGDEHTTLEGAKEILPKVVARNKKYDNQLGLFAAHLHESSEFIGWFILRPHPDSPDDHTNLEIGYRLKKKYWGKGYATEGSKALVKKAREDFNAKRIYAAAMKANKASVRVMEKLGLTFEKEYIEPGYEHTGELDVMYSKKFD